MNPVDSDLLPAGNLKHVARVARAIDHGLQELETVLGSVLNLMPCDENKPQALEAMRSVEQEVKDMEEATGNMLVELQNILSAGELNLQKARETNKSIEEGMLLIESTLEKYGYDSSKMPAFTQPDPDEEAANASEFEENEESFDDDESSAVECLTSDSPTTLSLQRNEAQTPAYQVSRTRVETMAGAELAARWGRGLVSALLGDSAGGGGGGGGGGSGGSGELDALLGLLLGLGVGLHAGSSGVTDLGELSPTGGS
ncbi:Myelin transcription factor 1 [Frankliniella fusca]|uniref:Myelin transcription factor 1 n=1 Tax=Frankliniella fusca TaxID=407009 RepID=A0AAE1LPF6_9NEOP|nr:Myelin transcription factor 1 [Frankliniella fusca]